MHCSSPQRAFGSLLVQNCMSMMGQFALQTIQTVFLCMEETRMSVYKKPSIWTADLSKITCNLKVALKDDTCYFSYSYCQPAYSGGFCEQGYQVCKLAYHI